MKPSPLNPRIIVIGTSSGGNKALIQILQDLPGDLPAAVFIVQHVLPSSRGAFAGKLNSTSGLEVKIAEDGEKIKNGHVYIAKADYHMLLKHGHIKLIKGPRENRFRPSIDPLFRSAAVSYGPLVTGLILTGRLNDGASGLSAVKRAGGKAIIQDPEDAEYPGMPQHALQHVDPDHLVRLEEVAKTIEQIINSSINHAGEVPEDIILESQIMEKIGSNVLRDELLGSQVALSCPDCGGPLWEMKNDPVKRYRCHIGHSYTSEILLNSQDNEIEESLWVAMRMLEERTELLLKMVEDHKERERPQLGKIYEARMVETKKHLENLKKFLLESVSRDENMIA